MEDNTSFANNCFIGSNSSQELKTMWEDLTLQLNAEGPPIKNSAGWKKVLDDHKTNLKKIRNSLIYSRGTGGGPARPLVLTSEEERVVAITGLQLNVSGVEGCTFGLPKTNPTASTPSSSSSISIPSSSSSISIPSSSSSTSIPTSLSLTSIPTSLISPPLLAEQDPIPQRIPKRKKTIKDYLQKAEENQIIMLNLLKRHVNAMEELVKLKKQKENVPNN